MKIKAGEKMRKIWSALFFISCLSFTNCMSNSTNSFENMAIQIEGSEKDDLLRVTISGFNPTSMIFIKDYHIEYDGNKVFIKINETQKDAGIAMDVLHSISHAQIRKRNISGRRASLDKFRGVVF